jgi:hypothetical protein
MEFLNELLYSVQTWPLWDQPIDRIVFQFFIWFGWIPIAAVLFWGFSQVWLAYRMGLYSQRQEHMLLAVDVPAETEQTPKALENFFASLYGAKSSPTWKEKWIDGKFNAVFSFEIVSNEGYIQFLIRARSKYRDVIEAGIYAHYPEAEITEVDDYASWAPEEWPDDEYETWGAELTLKNDWIFPIRTYEEFEDRMQKDYQDPVGQVLEQMAKMRPGEHFWFQILIQPVGNDWQQRCVDYIDEKYEKLEEASPGVLRESLGGLASLPNELLKEALGIDLAGGGGEEARQDMFREFNLTPREKEELEKVLYKSRKVGYRSKMRMVYIAKQEVFNKGPRATMIKGLLNQYTNLNLNGFGLYGPTVPSDDYFWQEWSYSDRQQSLIKAYKNRSFSVGANPVFLNAEELATLWHFPSISVKTPLIRRAMAKRAEPPTGLPSTQMEDALPTGPSGGGEAGPPKGAAPGNLPMAQTSEPSEAAQQEEDTGSQAGGLQSKKPSVPRPTPPTAQRSKQPQQEAGGPQEARATDQPGAQADQSEGSNEQSKQRIEDSAPPELPGKPGEATRQQPPAPKRADDQVEQPTNKTTDTASGGQQAAESDQQDEKARSGPPSNLPV